MLREYELEKIAKELEGVNWNLGLVKGVKPTAPFLEQIVNLLKRIAISLEYFVNKDAQNV